MLEAFSGQQVAELRPASWFLVFPRQHHHSLYPFLPRAPAVSNRRRYMWLEHSDNFLDESFMFLAFLLVKLQVAPPLALHTICRDQVIFDLCFTDTDSSLRLPHKPCLTVMMKQVSSPDDEVTLTPWLL